MKEQHLNIRKRTRAQCAGFRLAQNATLALLLIPVAYSVQARAQVHMGVRKHEAVTNSKKASASDATGAILDPYTAANGSSPYGLKAEDRAQADALAHRMVNAMSQSEKIAYIGSNHFGAQEQFNLPELVTAEGTNGVAATVEPSVVYPSAISLAATWNPVTAAARGHELALDAQAGGVQLVNGPGLNFYRTPYGGRESEFLSGEDPILGSVLGASYVEGQQSTGVMAELKHIFANDQESNRTNINETIDQRTLHEMYQLPFESVIKTAQPAAVMCAFTLYNGVRSCEHTEVNVNTAEGQWGFNGFFQSDWGAISDVSKAIKSHIAIDASGGAAYSETAIQAALDAGTITKADLDLLVYNVIRQMLYYKMGPNVGTPETRTEPDRQEGADFSTASAAEGMVLLKNENKSLPLTSSVKSIAVMGSFANLAPPRPVGSGWGPFRHYVTEYQGLKALAPAGTTVDLIQENTLDPANAATVSGWKAYYFNQPLWQGYPSVMQSEANINFDWSSVAEPACSSGTCGSAVWTAQIRPTFTSDYVFKVHGNGQMQVVINGERIAVTNSVATTGSGGIGFQQPGVGKMHLIAGQTYDITVTYSYESTWVGFLGGITGAQFSYAALSPAPSVKKYDAVIVSGGLGGEWEGEGVDHDFDLPEYQSELIANVAEANPHTTAVLYTSSAVNLTGFNDKVKSLLYAWYPGQNSGTALAKVLFGEVNPSGKLPITLDRAITENPAVANFPMPLNYDESSDTVQLPYTEGLYFGYRGYEKNGITPLYPFGHGLSYSTFRYSDLKTNRRLRKDGQVSLDVSFDVTNEGNQAGAEAAQVYVGQLNPSVDRPKKELKGFDKQMIKAGETKHYTIQLPERALAYYDTSRDQWKAEAGNYEISVGASSADIRLHTTYRNPTPYTLSPSGSAAIFDPGFKQ